MKKIPYLLQLLHRRLIGPTSALQVRPVSIAISGIRVALHPALWLILIPKWSVLVRNVFGEKRSHGAFDQLRRKRRGDLIASGIVVSVPDVRVISIVAVAESATTHCLQFIPLIPGFPERSRFKRRPLPLQGGIGHLVVTGQRRRMCAT